MIGFPYKAYPMKQPFLEPNTILKKRVRSERSAFTLIELLTVIAIIGVLAAILIPVVGSMRVSAKIAKSTTNLREIGNTIQLYRLDHNNRFPVHQDASGTLWIEELWPYSNPGQELIRLNSTTGPDVLKDTIYYTPMVEDDPRARSFGYNFVVDYGFNQQQYGGGDAARICLVADSRTSSALSATQVNFRNRGQANILFVDSHVELRSPEQVPESHHSMFWRGVGD